MEENSNDLLGIENNSNNLVFESNCVHQHDNIIGNASGLDAMHKLLRMCIIYHQHWPWKTIT